jgi:hypothetical protein
MRPSRCARPGRARIGLAYRGGLRLPLGPVRLFRGVLGLRRAVLRAVVLLLLAVLVLVLGHADSPPGSDPGALGAVDGIRLTQPYKERIPGNYRV